jgi:hypothetical protein
MRKNPFDGWAVVLVHVDVDVSVRSALKKNGRRQNEKENGVR